MNASSLGSAVSTKADIFAKFEKIVSDSNIEKVTTDFGDSKEATRKLRELDKITFKMQILKVKEFSDVDLNQIDTELSSIQSGLIIDQSAPIVDKYADGLLSQFKQILNHLRLHQKVSGSYQTTMSASRSDSSEPRSSPVQSPFIGDPHAYLSSSHHQQQVLTDASTSSSSLKPETAIEQTEITQSQTKKTKVIFPLGIQNGGFGSCYVKCPIQGLMGSQSFLAYLDSIEDQLRISGSIETPNEILNMILEIKRYWSPSNISYLNQLILDLRALLQEKHPGLSRDQGGEMYRDFLIPFLEDIGYIPMRGTLNETTQPAATFILKSHRQQSRSLLKDVVQADLGPAFLLREGHQPDALILYVSLNNDNTNNALRFPRTGLIELLDSQNEKHTYRLTSFSRLEFAHYTQCLNVNNQWYEYDTAITHIEDNRLTEKLGRAYILYFDKVQEESSNVIEEPVQTASMTGTSQTFSDSPLLSSLDFSRLLDQVTATFASSSSISDKKTKVAFPLGILNGKGYCYISSPIQGLMRSPSFLAYLDWKEGQLKSSGGLETTNDLLKVMFKIKRNWKSNCIDSLSDSIKELRDVFTQFHPNLDRGRNGGDAYEEFLSTFLEDIGYISPLNLTLEASPSQTAASSILYSNLMQPRLALQEVIQQDTAGLWNDRLPDSLLLNVTLNEKGHNNSLQFPEDGLIRLTDSQQQEQLYRLNSFSYYTIGHYTQCLMINSKWFECDKGAVTRLSKQGLEQRQKRASILFFDKVKDESPEIIEEPVEKPKAGFQPLPVLHLKSRPQPARTIRSQISTTTSTTSSPISSSPVASTFSGSHYEGEYRGGLYHGKGKQTLLSGEVKEGHFAYGQFKKGTISYSHYDEISEERGSFLHEQLLDGDDCTRKYWNGMVEQGSFSRGKFQHGTRTHGDGRVENI